MISSKLSLYSMFFQCSMELKLKVRSGITDSHIGYVTPCTLIRLNLLNGTWVHLKYCQEKSTPGVNIVSKQFKVCEKVKDSYIVQVFAFEETFESNDFLKDCLYLALISQFNLTTVPGYDSNARFIVEPLQSVTARYPPDNYASGVEVSAISCPSTVDDSVIDELLVKYFEVPRMLSPNELFQIPLSLLYGSIDKKAISFSVQTLLTDDKRHGDLQTNSRFVSSDFTKMHLKGNVSSHVPFCSCVFKGGVRHKKLVSTDSFNAAFQTALSKLNEIFLLSSKDFPCRETACLVSGQTNTGKSMLIRKVCAEHGYHVVEETSYSILGDSLAASEQRLGNLFSLTKKYSPCVLLLRNVEVLGKDKDGTHAEPRLVRHFQKLLENLSSEYKIIFFGVTSSMREVSPDIVSSFLYKIDIIPPAEEERFHLLTCLTQGLELGDTSLTDVAKKTAGMFFGDFVAVINRVLRYSYQDTENCDTEKRKLSTSVFCESVEWFRDLKANQLSSVHIPQVKWEDVGGLADVKSDILDTIQLPLKYPELFTSGLRRSGLLLYGPPGCGKTLLAKAVATEFSLNFFSVKGPELINMYVGQSEENVREVFVKARQVKPCVVFFDELDSLAPSRGRSGDAGGVMDRVVSQLLAELDGMHDNNDIFVIGATNRPDLLDTALLRPGRFDKLIYVGLPVSEGEKLKLMHAVTRKLNLSANVSLSSLVPLCPLNMTGADFYALAADATMGSLRRAILAHEREGKALPSEGIQIEHSDFVEALQQLTPSVSNAELKRYQQIKTSIQSLEK